MGMKRFVRKSSVWVFLGFLFCIGVELILLTKPNVYSYKRKYIENHLNDIVFLLMGNSHIEEGLVPELLCDSAFNFAISAKSWSCDIELAERYVPNMPNLKMVLMPFSYHYFELGRTVGGVDVMTPKERLQANNTYKCMQTKYLKVRQYGWKYLSEIMYSSENYMGRLKLHKDSRPFCDSLGFVSLKAPESRSDGWKKARVPGVLDVNRNRNEEDYQKLKKGYERIAQICFENGVDLILISAPVYTTYQDAISPIILTDMYNLADSINAQYHNVRYYNFFFAEGFSDDDFMDAGHLTESGATKFTKMLRDSLFIHPDSDEIARKTELFSVFQH